MGVMQCVSIQHYIVVNIASPHLFHNHARPQLHACSGNHTFCFSELNFPLLLDDAPSATACHFQRLLSAALLLLDGTSSTPGCLLRPSILFVKPTILRVHGTTSGSLSSCGKAFTFDFRCCRMDPRLPTETITSSFTH